jgi:hypothetical protein
MTRQSRSGSPLERYREVIILTKDEDLQEQHYKLMYLMDTQYRGMLLADRYHRDPASLASRPLPASSSVLAQAFDPCEGVLIDRTADMEQGLLPANTFPISLHCWVVGKTFSQLTFAADSGMRNLLAIKGRTRGLNTELFGGRNCHFWLAPLPLQEGSAERKCAAISRDRLVDVWGTQMPLLDVNQSLRSLEGFIRLHFTNSDSANTIPSGER